MDPENLIAGQDALQREAAAVLNELGLLPFLNQHGKALIVGSVATGLMTWRDIDIEVMVPNSSHETILSVADFLLKNDKVKSVKLSDNTGNRRYSFYPDGMYVGFKYLEKEPWKVDIWFISKEQHTGKDDVEWLKNIDEAQKQTILEIKSRLAGKDSRYAKSVFSFDIYTAVLKENIRTYDEFVEYLKRNGRYL